jgi:hypothetical protein
MSLEKSTPIAPMLVVPMRPYAVKIAVARTLLGGKSRSRIYELASQGRLDLVKDDRFTLVTTASIEAYNAALPTLTIKPYERKPPARRASHLLPHVEHKSSPPTRSRRSRSKIVK